ncbi:hypothetical protein RB195_023059 [Necator americanus]|uniref:C2H2-type domain-containing protein n=1 Tax=Necator americanus TaxID=51031 RepID=A0ABR1EHP9_NECAM
MERLDCTERKPLRRLLSYFWPRVCHSEEIDVVYRRMTRGGYQNLAPPSKVAKVNRLRFFGHILRRPADRLLQRVLRSLSSGRKRKFWTEVVKENVRTLGVDRQYRVFFEGHALRNLPSRIMRSDSFNRDLTVTFEHTLLGARCFYRVDAPWTVGGFIVGENNVTLIEQEKLTTDISSPLIVSELEYWTKRLHTNPFLQMRVVCGPSYDEESDCYSSERSYAQYFDSNCSRSWDGVDGDDELSACSERDELVTQKVEVKRTIDPYLGIFSPDDAGKYVNHIRTIETIFHPLKAMGRLNLVLVQNWLRLEIPPTIIYRICSGVSPREFGDESPTTLRENQDLKYCAFGALTEVEKMGWITVVDQTQTDRCIICERSFKNMYSLLLHYHLSYPRLIFQLNFRTDPQQDERWHRLHIDVFLNPDFDDVHEVPSCGNRGFIRAKDLIYTWTRDQAIELKSKARMDLTIFCDALKSAGQSLDDPVEEQRFIHPESGRWLYRGERLPHYARHLPAPGHEVLAHSTTRRLLDFVDLSDGSKWFMITWNTMMVTMGKARCDEAASFSGTSYGCYGALWATKPFSLSIEHAYNKRSSYS